MGLFSWLKMGKPKTEDTQYSFIWYARIRTNASTYFTQPFRTRVTANSFEEARKIARKTAQRKMELILVTEDEYNKKDPMKKVSEEIDGISSKIDNIFKAFKNATTK